MEQVVRVVDRLPDGAALVLHTRQSACSGDCHSCSGCGAQKQQLELKAKNPIGAAPGDWVTVESATGPVLISAVLLYIVPIVMFVGCYLAGELLWAKGPLVGLLGFVLGLVPAGICNRALAKNKTVYTITGFANKPRTGDEEV